MENYDPLLTHSTHLQAKYQQTCQYEITLFILMMLTIAYIIVILGQSILQSRNTQDWLHLNRKAMMSDECLILNSKSCPLEGGG